MKIRFYLRYSTQPGESLSIRIAEAGGDRVLPLVYLNSELWASDLIEVPAANLQYQYHFDGQGGLTRDELGRPHVLNLAGHEGREVHVVDFWEEAGAVENAFLTQPFRAVFNASTTSAPSSQERAPGAEASHLFRVRAPMLRPGQVICLLGHGVGLRNWDSAAPLLLRREGDWWTIRLDLAREDFPLAYKYGIWDAAGHRFLGFEDGPNRPLYPSPAGSLTVLNDGFARLPSPSWRGAGVAIPVFSLRSENSFGVGEFTDLHALADWGHATGLKLIQLLPVNDTSATGTWTDSYPYAAISAFALHPVFLNLAEVAGKKHAALLKPFAARQKALNALEAVDYEAVLTAKWEMIRLLYAEQKNDWAKDKAYQSYFADNRHWLLPYAAFCYLKTRYGTVEFDRWPEHGRYSAKAVEQLSAPTAAHYDEIAIHYFVQWQLHRQLKAAADYAHARGLALKGDIPIGIYRYSCDAWMEPELYHMDQQAGAPPDDFAVAGQNWGFPTYNWERMKQDGFAWWRRRFAQMSGYFDAFRIDHILGFFRIWSIPLDAVQGILGRFVPAIPVGEHEFYEAGIGFNRDRLCRPFINDIVLQETFGDLADFARRNFLEQTPDSGHWSGLSQYTLLPAYDTQRKVEQWFEQQQSDSSKKGAKKGKNAAAALTLEENVRLRDGLYDLIANVILLDAPGGYAFRIAMEKTSSYRFLPAEVKEPLNALYINYFFRRQDDFWAREAYEKLPELKRSTEMLICGEDLGMVPDCVPDVMRALGILSLEIQRMPKQAGRTFFHPKDAPYLAVVTPSTHDMSTIRGWWEEDRDLTQRFFNEQLGYEGHAPYFCEPWVARTILAQHFHSPAMWAIFQIQDLLSMDGALRRQNPAEERINVPANPKHYWRYRMHISLENLQKAEGFNAALRELVGASGRG
ncbi:MAG: 4-alpha-glucanotransferase [Saprospiraceae bacterium]